MWQLEWYQQPEMVKLNSAFCVNPLTGGATVESIQSHFFAAHQLKDEDPTESQVCVLFLIDCRLCYSSQVSVSF